MVAFASSDTSFPELTGGMLLTLFVAKGLLLVVLMVVVGERWGFFLWLAFMSLHVFSKVEEIGVWPDGLLDAPIAGGNATPLGQRPLSFPSVTFRIRAPARMVQLEEWFKSWAPDSVCSAGGGRSSVEAWCTDALNI